MATSSSAGSGLAIGEIARSSTNAFPLRSLAAIPAVIPARRFVVGRFDLRRALRSSFGPSSAPEGRRSKGRGRSDPEASRRVQRTSAP